MRNYILEFLEYYQAPEEAITSLLQSFDVLQAKKESAELFSALITPYIVDETYNLTSCYPQLEEIAVATGVPPYIVYLLYFISLSKYTKQHYEKHQYPAELFYASMADLSYKMKECYELHQVYGNCVPWWEDGFFNLSRFALGRFQYEKIKMDTSLVIHGHLIKKGDTVINFHIPSSGPLTKELCFSSFAKASEFYAKEFESRPIVFVCHSWLLFPHHLEFLPKESNILMFLKFFTVYETEIDEEKSDLWRIFYQDATKPFEELPRNTSLQRAYADWLEKGNPVGCGKGVFLYQDGAILT